MLYSIIYIGHYFLPIAYVIFILTQRLVPLSLIRQATFLQFQRKTYMLDKYNHPPIKRWDIDIIKVFVVIMKYRLTNIVYWYYCFGKQLSSAFIIFFYCGRKSFQTTKMSSPVNTAIDGGFLMKSCDYFTMHS